LVLAVQVDRPRAPAELTQAMVNLPLFQVAELLRVLQLAAEAVVLVTQQVHLVDQAAAAVLMALADLALWVKVI